MRTLLSCPCMCTLFCFVYAWPAERKGKRWRRRAGGGGKRRQMAASDGKRRQCGEASSRVVPVGPVRRGARGERGAKERACTLARVTVGTQARRRRRRRRPLPPLVARSADVALRWHHGAAAESRARPSPESSGTAPANGGCGGASATGSSGDTRASVRGQT